MTVLESAKMLTLAEAATAFQNMLVAKSRETGRSYTCGLRRFRKFLADIGMDWETASTNQLSEDCLEQFFIWALKRHGREHKSTAITYTAAVRAFLAFCDRRRWLSPNISFARMKDGLRSLIGTVRYKTQRVDDTIALVVVHALNTPPPPADRANATRRLEALRDKAILATLYGTGMRREEVSRLDRASIQDGEGLVAGKGDKERVVFFDTVSLDAIRAYLRARPDSYAPLFIRHDKGRGGPGPRGEHWRLSGQSIWAVVKKYAALAGVPASPHQFRHLKACIMLNQGAQLSEVQDILGHASPETTKKIYAAYTTRHLREAFDRFSVPAEEVAAGVVGQDPGPPAA